MKHIENEVSTVDTFSNRRYITNKMCELKRKRSENVCVFSVCVCVCVCVLCVCLMCVCVFCVCFVCVCVCVTLFFYSERTKQQENGSIEMKSD
jgi:Flp pilus assembly protein TadB